MKTYDFVVAQDDTSTPDTVEKTEKNIQAETLKEALQKLRDQLKLENTPQ